MRKRNLHINDDLLIRYLADEVSEAERTAVENWLAENNAHQRRLDEYRTIFNESKALKSAGFGDTEKAWDQFKQLIDKQEEDEAPAYPFKRWLRIAAVLLAVTSVSIWLYLRQPGTVNYSAVNKPLVDSLPDGSLISLSAHSSLAFRPGKVREAILKGEAFFEVRHDTAHPFRIRVNNLVVNVLGTSFNIRSIGDQTQIIVRSGVVGISGDNKSIQLQAGEQLLAVPGGRWNKQAQSSFDINNYPGLVHAILKFPGKWPELLKSYVPKQDGSTIAGKNRALVRAIMRQFITDNIAADGSVRTFRLDDSLLVINRVAQPESVQRRYKTKYLPRPGYFIYLGNEQPNGDGIIVKPGDL